MASPARQRAIRETVKGGEAIYQTPDLCIGRMEYMRPIRMHIHAFDFLAMQIASHVLPLVYYETTLPVPSGQPRKGAAEKPRPYNQVVVAFIHALFFIALHLFNPNHVAQALARNVCRLFRNE